MTNLDRIMFGDNQFFGVNHMSEEKARTQAMRFRDTESIMDVIDAAYDLGIRTFMCTTHAQIAKIVERVGTDPARYDRLVFHPGMPYAHKYANMVGELGIVETVRYLTPGGLVEAAIRGARATAGKDVRQLMQMLVDAEMTAFTNVETPVIFLQNVIADLLLGLGMHEILADFHDYVHRKYGAAAGYFTMNMPRMVEALQAQGVANPIICCNYNAIGFRMSGGIEAYDKALNQSNFRCIAMSVLASGAIPPTEAIKWVCERPEIESIVFGASTRSNIAQTIELIHQYTRS